MATTATDVWVTEEQLSAVEHDLFGRVGQLEPPLSIHVRSGPAGRARQT